MSTASTPLHTGVKLAIVALLATALSGIVHWNTQDRIRLSQEKRLATLLGRIIPTESYNNDLLKDTIEVADPLLGSAEPQRIWRARLNGEPVAAVLSVTAPDGYGGPITLLVGILTSGEISSARVLVHRETPGLGDDIEISRSDWINGFNEQSLLKLTASQWRVKKDGGKFDQFTGATITPRAVTSAIYSALTYFDQHQETLFGQAR